MPVPAPILKDDYKEGVKTEKITHSTMFSGAVVLGIWRMYERDSVGYEGRALGMGLNGDGRRNFRPLTDHIARWFRIQSLSVQ